MRRTATVGDNASSTRARAVVVLAVGLALACAVLQILTVRPFLPPGGHGATLVKHGTVLDAAAAGQRMARPPDPAEMSGAVVVGEVHPGSAAAAAGLRRGDVVLAASNLLTGQHVDLARPVKDGGETLRRWRDSYWLGTRGPLDVRVQRGGETFSLRVDRPPAWSLPWKQWAEAVAIHAGPLIDMASIVGATLVLLLLRPRDPSALLIVATLACAGTSTGGTLAGGEAALPPMLRAPLTMFSWLAMPLAFPLIPLAVLYFPRKSHLLVRRWLHAVPILVSLPMVVPAAGTAMFLAGADAAAGLALWDASHPQVFSAAFAAGLLLNILAMVEAVWRFKHNPDRQERRRVAFATFTLVLATVAFTIREGIPALAAAASVSITLPWWANLALHLVTALAGVGITYTVAVNRVLSPRVVVRQSLQYALARKTMAVLAALPAMLLGLALYKQRDRSLADVVSGQPLLYALLLVLVVATIRHRDRAKAWLDRRFFRQDYDARAVLLSLSGRIPFETDPNELMALVVHQIDAALKPAMVAVLVSGVEADTLVPVSVLHGTADTLPAHGGIGSMLTWSDTPLDLDLDNERSAATRLPPDEIEWLRCTGASLMVPLSIDENGTRRLLGALVLGSKRSEEPYSTEDRALLSSIGAQVSLGLDIARLRRRQAPISQSAEFAQTMLPTGAGGMLAECLTCRTCHDSATSKCPHDGTVLRQGRLPRVVDAKYRVDLVLGRGGMGAVYRAHDMRLERDVAIKVVRAELLHDPDARTRFRREAQVVARLQHPGIVSVFDYGTLPEGAAFLVMEYVRGRDLRAVLREQCPLPSSRVAELMEAIATPVDAAHQRGILHRDLKPENILLSEDDRRAKILDFGVAKLIGSDDPQGDTLTVAGQPIGTPSYMAPEQLSGRAVTVATDIYALGVMAYEMLSGHTPFGLGPIAEIAIRQRDGAPRLEHVEGIPSEMARAVASALDPDPGRRPASATAFAAMLR